MKLLISDFDDTFLDEHDEENVEAVKKFVKDGNLFVLASSQNGASLLDDIITLSIPYSYLICNDGASIYDNEHNCVYRKNMELSDSSAIFERLDRDKNNTETYLICDESYCVYQDTEAMCVISCPKDIKKGLFLLDEILLQYPNIQGYLNKKWLTFHRKDTNKKTAINKIAEWLDIENENIYTIGNSMNDREMLESFHSYIIGNDESVSDIASIHVESVKDAIEKILNNE